jgi:hypothetical protein
MTKYPAISAHSDAHRNANALTIIGVKNTEAARIEGLALIESLTLEEAQQTLAAFATQAAGHIIRALGGADAALWALQQVGVRMAALPTD